MNCLTKKLNRHEKSTVVDRGFIYGSYLCIRPGNLKELPEDLHGKNHTEAIDHAEAAALYAEYAMDFATLSMRQALAAALAALLQAAENQETNEKGATQYE